MSESRLEEFQRCYEQKQRAWEKERMKLLEKNPTVSRQDHLRPDEIFDSLMGIYHPNRAASSSHTPSPSRLALPLTFENPRDPVSDENVSESTSCDLKKHSGSKILCAQPDPATYLAESPTTVTIEGNSITSEGERKTQHSSAHQSESTAIDLSAQTPFNPDLFKPREIETHHCPWNYQIDSNTALILVPHLDEMMSDTRGTPAIQGKSPENPLPPVSIKGNNCVSDTTNRPLDDSCTQSETRANTDPTATHTTLMSVLPAPRANIVAATLALTRDALLPSPTNQHLLALRESAKILIYAGSESFPREILGIAIAEDNDGKWDGTNNCLMLSMKEHLVPSPRTLRGMLVDFFCSLDNVIKRDLGLGILRGYLPIEMIWNLSCDELTARCSDLILNHGHIYAPLLVDFLINMGHVGRLDDVLKTPVDLVFFQERCVPDTRCVSEALFSYSFRHPSSGPRALAMILCNKEGKHFVRLRTPSHKSEIWTSESGCTRPSRTPCVTLRDSILAPLRKLRTASTLRSFVTRNPFEALNTICEEPSAAAPEAPERAVEHSLPEDCAQPAVFRQKRSRQKTRPQSILSYGPRRVRFYTSDCPYGEQTRFANRVPHSVTLGDFIPQQWGVSSAPESSRVCNSRDSCQAAVQSARRPGDTSSHPLTYVEAAKGARPSSKISPNLQHAPALHRDPPCSTATSVAGLSTTTLASPPLHRGAAAAPSGRQALLTSSTSLPGKNHLRSARGSRPSTPSLQASHHSEAGESPTILRAQGFRRKTTRYDSTATAESDFLMSPDGTDPGDAHAVTGKEFRITGKARSCGSTTNVFRAGGTGQVLSSYDAKNAMEADAEGQSMLVGTGDSDVVGKGDVDKGGRHDVCNRGNRRKGGLVRGKNQRTGVHRGRAKPERCSSARNSVSLKSYPHLDNAPERAIHSSTCKAQPTSDLSDASSSDYLHARPPRTTGLNSRECPPNPCAQPPETPLLTGPMELGPTTMPVRFNGRFYSVSFSTLGPFSLETITQKVLESLVPRCTTGPQVLFFGCPRGDSRCGVQLIRRLRDDESPNSWEGVDWLKHCGGFIEIRLPLRGGSKDSQDASVPSQSPPYSTDLDWVSIDDAFDKVTQGQQILGDSSATASMAVAVATHLGGIAGLLRFDSLRQHVQSRTIDPSTLLSPARITALSDLLSRYPAGNPSLPPGYQSDQWFDVRFNNVRFGDLGFSSQRLIPRSHDLLRDAFLELLLNRVPALQALRRDDGQQQTWKTLKANVKVRGNADESQYLSIVALLPPGDQWRVDLLNGTTRVTDASYVTPNPTDHLVEVELCRGDSDLLRAVAASLNCSDYVFFAMLAMALSRAWTLPFAHCRYNCEVSAPTGQRRSVFVDPCSPHSCVLVGLGLEDLLRLNRADHVTTVSLGFLDQTPVALRMRCPSVPPSPLWNLLNSDYLGPALRVIPLDPSTDPAVSHSNVVVGPLPRLWLSRRAGSARAAQVAFLAAAEMSMTSPQVITCMVSGNSDVPFAVFFRCVDPQAARDFVAFLRSNEGQQWFEGIMGLRPPALLESRVPIECVALLGANKLGKLTRPGTQRTDAHV